MKKLNKHNNSGFTLIELIIVVIILGILAAVALPKFSSTFDTGKIAEVNQFTGALKKSVDTCQQITGAAPLFTGCSTYAQLGVTPPDSAFFTYGAPTTSGSTFTMVAGLKPSTGTNFITVVYTPTAAANTATGVVVISYVGVGTLGTYNKFVATQ